MSKPEVSFKVGAVRAAIFRNTLQRGTRTISIGKVILEVRYRDKDGQWKSTHSMSANEIPKAILALQKAYEHLMCRPSEETESEPAESVEVVHEKVQ
jgi:hypothetical protein